MTILAVCTLSVLILEPSSVRVEKDSVLIAHLYTERRLTPLNLYLRESDRTAACEAVLDYGQTVKDLAAGSALRFAEVGEHELEGVPGTWRLFRVLP